ncbi:MAG: DNA repair protein RecO [Chloroherpetonaceae bacterium]|nr:DNA repair protein RecO [Chloroherpetonaceae bacterium]MDW8437850.1 DNA repair protein RecO [Chloroherpetonaceae bacterium]
MSLIKKTDAIVLRSIDYRDQSKILTLYTKDFGRISAIAKGARSAQSKFASAFELGSHVAIVLYKKSTRDIQNIADATLKTSFFSLVSSMEKLNAMHQILELARICTEDDEPNLKLYNLLLGALQRLERFKKNALNLAFHFQVQLISLLGFAPSFKECVVSGKPIWESVQRSGEKELLLVPEMGGLALRSEAIAKGVSGKPVSLQVFRLIDLLSTSNPDELESLVIQDYVIGDVAQTLDAYFRHHIEGFPQLRSREVFAQIARSGG